MTGPADALTRILGALDRLEIPYMVGGSVASSIHGISRPTMDVDIIAVLQPGNIAGLCEFLKADFYCDAETARDAIARGRAFNVIHFSSSYKFDIFPLQPGAFDQEEFSRRELRESAMFGERIEFSVASAEDTILAKLRWYRLGGEVSERQWNDILGIIQVQQGRLDWKYLAEWAGYLNLSDLLDRLRK